MTIEEAISYVQETRKYLADYSETEQEECDMAVSPFRVQQTTLDRSWWEGCEYCKDIPVSILKGFCYACGRPLTEEAWAELERRINGGTVDNET